MNANWKDVELPNRMKGMEKDSRGFPVPYIVHRDSKGKPHFTINDERRVMLCAHNRLCGICGQTLDPLLWLVGGPKSAFHEYGAYFDGPMHKACATYALKVCPWLALTRYVRRIEGRTLDPNDSDATLLVDRTQDPARPEVFVLAATKGMKIGLIHGTFIHHPNKPWAQAEYWQAGKRLTYDEATVAMERYAPEDLQHRPRK